MVLLLSEELRQLYAPSQFVGTFPITSQWIETSRRVTCRDQQSEKCCFSAVGCLGYLSVLCDKFHSSEAVPGSAGLDVCIP